MGSSGIEIIILAAIAVFLVARLYKVLGRRTGHERQRDPFAEVANDEKGRDKVIPLPERNRPSSEVANRQIEQPEAPAAAADSVEGPLQAGIDRIRGADPNFHPGGFMAGARAAFEMIVAAYASGDAAALRPLLANDVFDNFSNAIQARRRAGETLQTTLVGITAADMLEADLQGRNAVVTVKIVSDQINVTRDKDGQVVEGDPSAVTSVTDIWTFSRNTRSRDPNWALIATRSPN